MQLAHYVLALVLILVVEADSGSVTLEALCSSDRAGVRWTAHNVPSPNQLSMSEIHEVDLRYNCTNPNTEEELTDRNEDVKCFHRNKGIPRFDQTRLRSMTHIVGRELPPGTLCTFTADLENYYTDPIGSVTANCIVEADDSAAVLPAQCAAVNGTQMTQQCQCSCSPGFTNTSRYTKETIDGTLCEEINVTTSTVATHSQTHSSVSPEMTPMPVVRTSHLSSGLASKSLTVTSPGEEIAATHSPVEIHSQASSSVIMSSIEVSPTPVVRTQASLSSEIGFGMPIQTSLSGMESKSLVVTTPVISSTSNSSNSSAQQCIEIPIALGLLGPILIVLGSAVLVCLVRSMYQRHERKRLHERMALPFSQLKFEKIDPDFNPVKIDKRVVVSESIHTIFQALGSLDPSDTDEQTQESLDQNDTTDQTQEDLSTDNVSDTSSQTETHSLHSESVASVVSCIESEETILEENERVDLDVPDTPGYMPGSITNERVYKLTSDYMQSESIGTHEWPALDETSTPLSLDVSSDLENAREHKKDTSIVLETLPADSYLLPTFTPQVYFSFPRDMHYVK